MLLPPASDSDEEIEFGSELLTEHDEQITSKRKLTAH